MPLRWVSLRFTTVVNKEILLLLLLLLLRPRGACEEQKQVVGKARERGEQKAKAAAAAAATALGTTTCKKGTTKRMQTKICAFTMVNAIINIGVISAGSGIPHHCHRLWVVSVIFLLCFLAFMWVVVLRLRQKYEGKRKGEGEGSTIARILALFVQFWLATQQITEQLSHSAQRGVCVIIIENFVPTFNEFLSA